MAAANKRLARGGRPPEAPHGAAAPPAPPGGRRPLPASARLFVLRQGAGREPLPRTGRQAGGIVPHRGARASEQETWARTPPADAAFRLPAPCLPRREQQ